MLTKPRDPSKLAETSMYSHKRRRVSPLILVGLIVPLLLALVVGAVFVVPRLMNSHAATPNPNCSLRVPNNPLSAKGLATPYQLFAPDAAANGACMETNVNQSAFVQAAIFD